MPMRLRYTNLIGQQAAIEAAMLAPRLDAGLAAVHASELEKGNRPTVAVARKLVS